MTQIDRGRWSDLQGNPQDSPDTIELPSGGWSWDGEWEILKDEKTDAEGWEYSSDFKEAFHPVKLTLDYVRRRKWMRKYVRYGNLSSTSTNNTSHDSLRSREVY